MNSRERIQTALALREADRVPVAPSFLTRAGCEFPADAGDDAVWAMRQAAELFGRYPVRQ